jgi:hypothetical protein
VQLDEHAIAHDPGRSASIALPPARRRAGRRGRASFPPAPKRVGPAAGLRADITGLEQTAQRTANGALLPEETSQLQLPANRPVP